MVDYPPPGVDESQPIVPASVRLGAAMALGLAAGLIAGFQGSWQAATLIGWVVTAVAWALPVWWTVLRLDPIQASRHATFEDPHGATASTLVLGASIAALAAVVLAVIKAGKVSGSERLLLLGVGIAAIICSWGVVHTVFTLRYAGLYYTGPDGGVSFNEDDKPDYTDFAYLAFTIGMTYQVSDTDIMNKDMRRAALRHALLSYLLGTIIIAATINVAAGLAH